MFRTTIYVGGDIEFGVIFVIENSMKFQNSKISVVTSSHFS